MPSLEERVATLEYRTSRLEEVLETFIEHTTKVLDHLIREMLDFKNEMKAFKDETRDFEKRAEEDRKSYNKRMGEISNKLGIVVEDTIFPATRPVIAKYFKCDPGFLATRIQRKRDGEREEFDVVGACDDKVFLIEVKTTLRPQYIDDFQKKIERFRLFFPEYKDKELIPIFASLNIDENFVNMLTKRGFYAMAYREWDYMDILNYEALEKRKRRIKD